MKLQPTGKLFDDKPYETGFTARILSAAPEGGRIALVLEETLFFPEEGGQNPDTGEIEGFAVRDVQIRDGVITHYLEPGEGWEEIFTEGKNVSGRIDWTPRFSNMQNHTGEHILSGILYKKYGYQNVGFHLSPQIVTLDTSGPLTEAQVRELERDANRAVWENVAVTVEYPPRDRLADMFYRSKGEIEGPVRVVTIEGYDACACCAPHVKRSGEIGLILILKHEHYKGGTRFTFVCGMRALEAVQRDRSCIKSLTDLLTTSADELSSSVKNIMAESENRKQRGDRLMKKQAEMMIASQPETDGSIWLFDQEFDDQAKRILINGLVKKTAGYAGIFSGNDRTGYHFIAGSAALDARTVSTALRNGLGARGGGSPAMTQGHVKADRQSIEKILGTL